MRFKPRIGACRSCAPLPACAHGIFNAYLCTCGTNFAIWLGPGWGPHCYSSSERARRSCCRLLRARLKVSGSLIAELVDSLKRLLCASAARAAVCSSVRRERSVFPWTVMTPPRSWNLELEICIVRYRVESRKCSSPEQCMIAAAERDYIED